MSIQASHTWRVSSSLINQPTHSYLLFDLCTVIRPAAILSSVRQGSRYVFFFREEHPQLAGIVSSKLLQRFSTGS